MQDAPHYNFLFQIKKSGANVLLIQKSILRDALSDMALHFLTKMKVMVIKDIERDEIDFVSKTLGCRPIASADHILPEHLGHADLVEELQIGGGNFSKPLDITTAHHYNLLICYPAAQ